MTRAEVNLTTSETQSLSPCTSLISWVSGRTQLQVGGAPREHQSPDGEGELQRQEPSGPNTPQGLAGAGGSPGCSAKQRGGGMVRKGAW